MADILASLHPRLLAAASSMKCEGRKRRRAAHWRTAACISTGILTLTQRRVWPAANLGSNLVRLPSFACGPFAVALNLGENGFDFFCIEGARLSATVLPLLDGLDWEAPFFCGFTL